MRRCASVPDWFGSDARRRRGMVFRNGVEGVVKRFFSLLVMLLFTVALVSGCGSSGAKAPAEGGLTIKMLDVGQGDAILIRTAAQTILIDTSDSDEQVKFRAALQKEGVTVIDKLIITHPHRDHLGGAALLFKEFTVKAVYDNGQATTQKFYRDYLKQIKAKKIAYKALRDGDVLDFGGGVSFQVLSPTEAMVEDGGQTKDGKINLNLNSVVGRLVYNDFSMLFTGDAELPTEQGILQRHGKDAVKSLILKSPHHGSKTSSSPAYLKAVQPKVALISCGTGNEYHHPHPSTRKRYEEDHIDFYRTDRNGTITVHTDGHGYTVTPERGVKNDDTEN
jgi:competence protein ComEC